MLSLKDGAAGIAKYASSRFSGSPVLANLEVTKLCNATCDFCDYWQTRHEERLSDYRPVIRKINPLVTVVTGGEPMLRKDLPDIFSQIKECSGYIFTSMVTKGDLLDIGKARELFDSGMDQLAVSLDFPGERHDEYRGIKGLWKHISEIMPALAKEFPKKSVIVNTVIMDDNLDEVPVIADTAREWGIGISFSSYSVMKTNNESHFVDPAHMGRVSGLIDDLIEKRRKWKGTILSSEYYLREIPPYFERGGVPQCTAGIEHLQVTPSGHIKRCSEMPVVAHWSEFKPGMFQPTKCEACWFSCRGETQAPPSIKRALEYMGVWV